MSVVLPAAGQASGIVPMAEIQPVALYCFATETPAERHLAGICDAVAREIAAQTSRPVHRVESPADAGPQDIRVSLSLTASGKFSIAAQLGWETGEQSGEGPAVSLSVMDTNLDARFYQGFARQIVQLSDIPFHRGRD